MPDNTRLADGCDQRLRCSAGRMIKCHAGFIHRRIRSPVLRDQPVRPRPKDRRNPSAAANVRTMTSSGRDGCPQPSAAKRVANENNAPRHRASHWSTMPSRRSGVRLSLIARPPSSQGPAESVRRSAGADHAPRHRGSHGLTMPSRRSGVRLSLIARRPRPKDRRNPSAAAHVWPMPRATAGPMGSPCPQVAGMVVLNRPPRQRVVIEPGISDDNHDGFPSTAGPVHNRHLPLNSGT